MKTPSELAEKEQQMRELRQEAKVRRIESELEELTDSAIRNGGMTSAGGSIEYAGFSKDDRQIIDSYLAKHGWHCDYNLQETSAYFLVLTPIGNI